MANMYCKGQKANSVDFSNNYNGIFRGNRDIPYPEEKRRQENGRLVKKARYAGAGVDSWPGQTRFKPGETGIICKVCNFPILMEPFEWDSELKRCDNCGTYTELRRDIVHLKDCNANIFVKKEDLPEATRDILYPEEKRQKEIDRLMRQSKKEKCHDTDNDRHRDNRLSTKAYISQEKEEA